MFFTVVSHSSNAPLTVTFTNQSTPTSTITAYLWDLGDGFTSTITNPVHVYISTSSFTVTLTAFADAEQNTITKTHYITVTSAVPAVITNVITYAYDPLYRLTGANYSGAYTYTFAYVYDVVGNRTISTQTITSTLVTTYTYDAANRLTSVNGQAYTWDNNGNLTNDGSQTYLYNQANRLITVTTTGLTWSAAYNGDGARLKQSSNGSVTTYTLDLAAPLVQVLTMQEAGGKTAYLYGVTRIGEQQTSGWAYHLSDALGSVRQLADGSAQVTLARGYMPYGEVLWSVGDGSSAYGYTGEDWNVTTQVLYLRARYLSLVLGAFLTKDPELINAMQPSDSREYLYANGNPINLADPTGLCVFCELRDRVTVDARQVTYIYSRPDENSDRIVRLNDMERVQIMSDPSTQSGENGWRKIYKSGEGGPPIVGWVRNLRLLDNCGGAPGTFACLPVGAISWTGGFGPNRFACTTCGNPEDQECNEQKNPLNDCQYCKLRGLHNGLDIGAPAGSPLVWPSTSEGTVVGRHGGDASPNIVIEFEGVDVLFGHITRRYAGAARGDRVRPGQTIGESGSDHLHLGVRNESVFYNPLNRFSLALQSLIVSRLEKYPEDYDYGPYSIVSFNATQGGWFWDDCPGPDCSTGIVFLSGGCKPRRR